VLHDETGKDPAEAGAESQPESQKAKKQMAESKI